MRRTGIVAVAVAACAAAGAGAFFAGRVTAPIRYRDVPAARFAPATTTSVGSSTTTVFVPSPTSSTTIPPGDVVVPDLIGTTPRSYLGNSSVTFSTVRACPPGKYPGPIIAQTPPAGAIETPPLDVTVETCVYAF